MNKVGYNIKIEISKETLLELYVNKKMTSREVAEKLNTNKRIILKRLREYGIEVKPKVRYKKTGFWFEHGYKLLYIEGNKYIREHINIMENHLGRKLEKNEVVHHINRDKLDNRIENLQVMTNGEHSTLHHKGFKYSDASKHKMSISAKLRLPNHTKLRMKEVI